jgi:hypothetical protein
MMHARLLALTLSAVVALPTAHALAELPPAPTVTLTETFDAPFPAWESGWFGQNSNARNYYCYGETSCTESYGTYLWISDPTGPSGAPVTVVFNTAFGASLLSLQMDLRAYSASNLIVYDSAGAVLYDQPSQQSQYVTHAITSTNGISRFELTGEAAGNTQLDNLVAVSSVPEPGAWALLLLGAGGLLLRKRLQAVRG